LLSAYQRISILYIELTITLIVDVIIFTLVNVGWKAS